MKINGNRPRKLLDLRERIAAATKKNDVRPAPLSATPRESFESSSKSGLSLTPNNLFALGAAAVVGAGGVLSGSTTGVLSAALAMACLPGAGAIGTLIGAKLSNASGDSGEGAITAGLGLGVAAGAGLTIASAVVASPVIATALGVAGAMSGVIAAGTIMSALGKRGV